MEGGVTLSTEESWQSGLLPVTKSGIYYGEDGNARIAPLPTHGFEALTFDAALLVPHETAPVRERPPLAVVDS